MGHIFVPKLLDTSDIKTQRKMAYLCQCLGKITKKVELELDLKTYLRREKQEEEKKEKGIIKYY